MQVRAMIAAMGVALAVFTVSGAARAQTEPSEASLVIAREVVVLSGGEESMNAMIDVMAPTLRASIVSRGGDEATATRFTELFLEEFRAEAPRILELSAIAYAGAFSDQELTEMRDFFASSAGQALRRRGPELAAALARGGMIIGEEVGLRVLTRLTAETAPQANP